MLVEQFEHIVDDDVQVLLGAEALLFQQLHNGGDLPTCSRWSLLRGTCCRVWVGRYSFCRLPLSRYPLRLGDFSGSHLFSETIS